MAAATAALSSLPRLHTLILSGELSADPGQMPQLQTLAIELGDVERVLSAGAAERFPKLHTVLLRLPETPVVTEGQLAALRSLTQLQALRLWTGEETTRRVLTEYVDDFRGYFPQLSVQRCEWGIPFGGCDLRNARSNSFKLVFVKRGVLPENVCSNANTTGRNASHGWTGYSRDAGVCNSDARG
jgi:hypothetical protein